MGLRLFGSACHHDEQKVVYVTKEVVVSTQEQEKDMGFWKSKPEVPEKLPNPDPKNFNIVGMWSNGDKVVAMIHYPDCTNYEGMKILVYHGVYEDQLKAAKSLDPHFCNKDEPDHYSPFARFQPSTEGLNAAMDSIGLQVGFKGWD